MDDLALVAMNWDSGDNCLVSSPGTGLLLSFSSAKHCDFNSLTKLSLLPKLLL